MNLSQIDKNQKVLIKDVHAQSTLKKRFFSLGISINKEVVVLETSLQKNTIKIALGSTSIALRLDEAKLIEVENVA